MAPRRKGFPAVRRLRSALRSGIGIGGVSRAAVRRIACAVLWLLPGFASAEVLVGMTDTAAYFPRLAGRRVAVLANQTSVADMPGAPGADASGRVHLVDLLHARGFDVTGFSRPNTASAVRPMPANMSAVRSMPAPGFRSARSTTEARAARRTRRCVRSTSC